MSTEQNDPDQIPEDEQNVVPDGSETRGNLLGCLAFFLIGIPVLFLFVFGICMLAM